MQWLKNINKQWVLSDNDIKYTDFKENLKSTTDLNIIRSNNSKSVIYIPTHNIHDVHEWFRIFKDSYTVSDEFDKYGYAIHGYFNKERGESIKGWFPNLIEVKATSTNEYKYYSDGVDSFRSSIDYIENFNNLSQLFIDGVEVFNEELVLLKHQYYETYDSLTDTWYKTSFENTNGVYQYLNNELVIISEMLDKYKTYNQIIYTYQGLTNENKQFYLRRHENPVLPGLNHGKYPTYGTTLPLIYSDGEAYLVKYELDYNLDILSPAHPTTAGPYDSTTDAYRLLFLDNTISDKILATDSNGIGTYNLYTEPGHTLATSDINMGTTTLKTIKFFPTDINTKKNILDRVNNDRYFLSGIVKPNYSFRHVDRVDQQYNIDFLNYNNIQKTDIIQNTNTSTITAIYEPVSIINPAPFISTTFLVGDFINLTYTFYDYATNTTYTALKEQFLIESVVYNAGDIAIEIFPKLDTNFVNEFNSFSQSTNIINVVEASGATVPYNINVSLPGWVTLGSYTLVNGDMLLALTQFNPAENGLYVYDSSLTMWIPYVGMTLDTLIFVTGIAWPPHAGYMYKVNTLSPNTFTRIYSFPNNSVTLNIDCVNIYDRQSTADNLPIAALINAFNKTPIGDIYNFSYSNDTITIPGSVVTTGTGWTIQTSAADNQWQSVTFGNGLFVAVAISALGNGNLVMTSTDGITWINQVSAANNDWQSVTFGNGLFVAVSTSGTGNRVMTSPDGINWTSRVSAANNNWTSITFGNGLFVAVASSGTGNRVMTSPDGITWTIRVSAANNQWSGVTFGNNLFVAVAQTGTGNRVMTSPDGITWTIQTGAADNVWQCITFGNGLFVAVSVAFSGDRVMTSPDGITWTGRTSSANYVWRSITYGNGLFVAVANSGTGDRVMTSPDAITWTSQTTPADNSWNGVIYGNNKFVAVGSTGTGNRVMTSSDNVIIGTTTSNNFLKFDGINQNHKHKWENHGVTLNVDSPVVIYSIDHTMDVNYRQYFKEYGGIQKFISTYLDCSPGAVTVNLAQSFNIQYTFFTYKNVLNANDRLGVEGSNKVSGYGNIIYFGSDYKEIMLDNIKPDTIVTYNDQITATPVWVSNIIWDEEKNVGIITLLNEVPISPINTLIQFYVLTDIVEISDVLSKIFDKELNSKNNPYDINSFTDSGLLLPPAPTPYIVNIAGVPMDYRTYKPDTASYAYAMLNYAYNSNNLGDVNDRNIKLLENITGIVYKEFNEPKISFLRRDKNFKFKSINIIEVFLYSVGDNIDLLDPITNVDNPFTSIGQMILILDQIDPTENGVYINNGVGNLLTEYTEITPDTYIVVSNPGVIGLEYQWGTVFDVDFVAPLTPSTVMVFTPILSIPLESIGVTTKNDKRLKMTPIEIAKLGVDNKTQPWKKINIKYDVEEKTENLVNIEINVNPPKIRFIDGLTERKIIENIAGQGKYAWILAEDVVVDNAIVGCTQIDGPGTGDLIWYTGTWEEGTWVDGIWIQGTWKQGLWMNGTFGAYAITDFYYYVTYEYTINNSLSTWESGIWLNGTFNSGTAINITWYNGIFNNGIINNGHWFNGTFNNGIINYIIWDAGTFHGGDFEKGIWHTGLFQELDPTISARFGTESIGSSVNFKDKAIWYEGIFDGGEFHSGNNTMHNGSIWYSGEFKSGDFYGGSFITGIFKNSTWYDGVWFGGYYATIAELSPQGANKRLTINPAQYDAVLGLTVCAGYVANSKHRLDKYSAITFILTATPNTSNTFTNNAFINEWDIAFTTTYPPLFIVPNVTTSTTIDLTFNSSVTSVGTTYQVSPDGSPFIYAQFQNSTWKTGIWFNGYFNLSIWETGSWINGYLIDSVFGI